MLKVFVKFPLSLSSSSASGFVIVCKAWKHLSMLSKAKLQPVHELPISLGAIQANGFQQASRKAVLLFHGALSGVFAYLQSYSHVSEL